MAITVRAKTRGYLDHLREPGDEFEIDDIHQFSERWMEKVKNQPPEKPADTGGMFKKRGPRVTKPVEVAAHDQEEVDE
jgi:hypothetical protein